MKSFHEVRLNPDIIIKFHKDVFLIDYEKISITVFDPEDNSIIYSEERKLVDEENDVNRLVAHFLAKVKTERGIVAEAKKAQAAEIKAEKEAVANSESADNAAPGAAKGLFVSSRPAGADIFINGAKQSGQTPTTLPLGPGQYDLVLRTPGYDAYAGHIQVKDNIQTTLDVDLKPNQEIHVAWAQVNSTPQGASIFVDGVPTDQLTPARVQVPTGVHIIALRLNGYQIAKHPIQASEGGTVSVTETLHLK